MGLNNINIDPKQMAHVEAIILSMTPLERRKPEIIKASRKSRIAKGCGLSVQEVNKLLTQFEQMKNDEANDEWKYETTILKIRRIWAKKLVTFPLSEYDKLDRRKK